VDLGLAGRAALVTAASRGLGFAVAKALVEEGARVAICARRPEGVEAARAALEALAASRGRPPGQVLGLVADVSRPEAPARLVADALAGFGRLDVLVANAGGPPPGRALEVDDAALEAALQANLLATVRLVRQALPAMRAGGWGRICAIASYSVKQALPGLALSNCARAGLWAWAKTAAADLAPEGITLNLACPGPHATQRMVELGGQGPMGDPDDFGKVVAFLCSQPAGFLSGAAVVVDGAATLAL
jgi:3-oxoacyl-[acyl-carrier protein] reductase